MAKINKLKKGTKKNWYRSRLKLYLPLGILVISLAIVLYQTQQSQDQRSRAVASNDCTVTAAQLSYDSDDQLMLQLVNTFREQNGFTALQPAASLNRAAAWMANDMNTTGKLDHTDSLNRGTLVRQVDCGQAENAGGEENLYTGTGTASGAQAAFDWWKASTAGHREAMLRATNLFVGVAHAGNYWALELSPERGSDSITPVVTPGVSVVPSSVCLGGCLLSPNPTQPQTSTTPVISAAPTVSVAPSSTISTIPVTPSISSSIAPSGTSPVPSTTPVPGTSNTGLIGLLLSFLALILKFLLSLFGR